MSLYGSQLWKYENTSVMESLYIVWRKCVRRIFKIPYNTHCKLVPLICQDTSIQLKLQKRFLRFFIKALKSDNSIVSMLAKHLVSGSRSKSCQTLNYVCHCHGLDKFSLSESCISRIQDASTESDIFTAELVLDFLGLRSTVHDDLDITDVIEYLCTS